MANVSNEKIDSVEKQDDFLDTEKSDILSQIDNIDTALDMVYNKILAGLIGKDISEINDGDYVGDKLEYIEYLAQDENTMKKIISAKTSYAKEKQKIKDTIIKLLKFKATIYDSNVKLISDLEQDILERKKEKCRLNLQIIEDEQEINSLNNHLAYCEDELQKVELESPEVAELQFKINSETSLLEAKLANLGIDSTPITKETMAKIDPEDEKELRELYSSISSLEAQYNVARSSHGTILEQKSKSVEECKASLKEKTNRLVDNKLKLGGLDIESKESKLLGLKETNTKLFENFETDIAEYQKHGIDISPEELKPTEKVKDDSVKNIVPENASNRSNGVRYAPTDNVVAPTPSTAVAQPTTAPVALSSKQIAQNIKGELLGSSNNDVRKMFKNGKLNELISSIGFFNRSEKKVLADRLDTLNEPLNDKQMLKLKNTIEALNKSGICGNFDLSIILYRNGKVKDLNKLYPEDLSCLNVFLTDLNNNRDIIDDSQFAFIQDTLLNNVRSKSLAHAIRPKSLRDFLRNASSKSPDKQIEVENSKLLNSITTMSEGEKPKVKNMNSFYETLIGKTRDEIVIPEQSKTVSDKKQSR